MSQTADREYFDMLPFIAILMCTLGSLLYVTLIVASLCIGPGAGEIWVQGHGKDQPHKIPVLIEWDGRVATVHRAGRRDRAAWEVSQQGAASASPLVGILAELERRKETHYALFAVRPAGFKTFNLFADEFRQRHIDVGYEPIEEGRPVHLDRERTRP